MLAIKMSMYVCVILAFWVHNTKKERRFWGGQTGEMARQKKALACTYYFNSIFQMNLSLPVAALIFTARHYA